MKNKNFNIFTAFTASGLIALVTILAGLFVLFDGPSFFSKKLDLADTTITIAEIKEIKQLNVAQYYGEVIHSLSDEECNEYIEDIYNFFKAINNDLKLPATKSKIGNSDERLYDYFEEAFLIGKEKNQDMINLMNQAYLKVSKKNDEPGLLKFIRDNTISDYISNYHIELLKLIRENLEIKERIAFLARGKVIAFIDLSKLVSGDYSVDQKGTLTLNAPLTIDSIINPLFLYGPGLSGGTVSFYGYQVINNSNSAIKTFSKVQTVKLGCHKKLIDSAIKDELVEISQKTAQEKLFAFISLFKTLKYNGEEREIKEVIVNVKPIKPRSKKLKILLDNRLGQ